MLMAEKKLLNKILDKIKKSESFRINLPCQGIIKMEKPVPFLVFYRIPLDGKDGFTSKLGKTESSYLFAEDTTDCNLGDLVRPLADLLEVKFNGFLLYEVWLSERTK